ncbi:transglycosylase domain-containing protein [Pseudoflavonifractor sp. An85]|uniref:transglycosylase domain-containing protein n=1 Tax=Pseudoflavonifractor sp. An85 TaxID=1965661 RepID=UPI000B36B15F|nr:transglycosylase domain-containing protein [Pseudoflavonifractor sp. An85]OUN25168.1 hypothetical protein B5G37_04410 [Pseudoflavonifractor sp. An85]
MSEMNYNRPSPERRPRRRHDASRTQGHSTERTTRSSSERNARPKKQQSQASTIALRVGKVLGTLLLIGIVTGAFMACYAAVYIKNVIIPEATLDLSAYTLNENSVIKYQDKNTGELVELQTLVGAENRQWVDYEDIPQDLINAVVVVEDKRFYEHNGVDWYRTAGAFVNMFIGMRNTFGGSTLTQQLVKNITEYDDVTVKRKILEIFTALELEKNYSKEDILTWYLNEIYLGQGCYGVQSAAQMYFGKDVSELSLAECASLAGITNNPSLYSPYSTLEVTRYQCTNCKAYSLTKDDVCSECGAKNSFDDGTVWTARDYNKARQEMILNLMADPEESGDRVIPKETAEQAKAEKLVFRTDWDEETQAEHNNADTSTKTVYSWYVEAVIDEVTKDLMEQTGLSSEVVTKMVYSGGLEIIVPYDPDVQAAVDAVYNDASNLNYVSKSGQQMKSAITVVDNESGMVVALAGDVGEKTINRGWNYATDTVRQPGSSIKPLSVYAPAIEEGLITPATVTDDVPRWMGFYWLHNYPDRYRGLTTVLEGVTSSINTISANVLEMLGFQKSFDYMANKFGISTMVEERVEENGDVKSDLGYSQLAVGGLTDGVSTFEMAAAYATFPRNGAFTEATIYLSVKDNNGDVLIDNTPSTEYILSQRTTFYINQMLTNVVSYGTGTAARISGQTVAGKTGTTDNAYDQWFVGYTSYYTAAVWIGYPYGESVGDMWPSPSTILWQKVMSRVHENLPQKSFSQPSGVTTVSICKDCGKLATDNCTMDIRGNRTVSMRLLSSDVPSGYCTCHVLVSICTECPILNANGKETKAYHIAGPYCPKESVKQVAMVDYAREAIESGDTIEDYYALLSIYNGLENEGACTLHTEATTEPEPEPSEPVTSPEPDVSPEPSEPVTSPDPQPSASQSVDG